MNVTAVMLLFVRINTGFVVMSEIFSIIVTFLNGHALILLPWP